MNGNKTQFLNVDLDLYHEIDISQLKSYFSKKMVVISSHPGRTSFELKTHPMSLEETLMEILNIVTSLPRELSSIWLGCNRRSFNIGIRTGSEKNQMMFLISKETINSLSKSKAELAMTLYL